MVVGQLWELACRVTHHLLCHEFLNLPLDVLVFALSGGEMATNGFAVALGLVLPRPMHQQGVEENDVSFFHFQVNPLAFNFLVLLYSKVSLVDLAIPVGIYVIIKFALVGLGHDV